MPAHMEYAKRTFNVLALFRTVMYFLSDNVTLILLAFPFLLTGTSHQESILLLFHFSDDMSYNCKYIL